MAYAITFFLGAASAFGFMVVLLRATERGADDFWVERREDFVDRDVIESASRRQL